MNRDELEKHGAASRRFRNDMSGNDTIRNGIDQMRSELIRQRAAKQRYEPAWKGVASHRGELAEMRNDLIGNGTEKNRGESAESRHDRSGNGKDKKCVVLRRKRDAQGRSDLIRS